MPAFFIYLQEAGDNHKLSGIQITNDVPEPQFVKALKNVIASIGSAAVEEAYVFGTPDRSMEYLGKKIGEIMREKHISQDIIPIESRKASDYLGE